MHAEPGRQYATRRDAVKALARLKNGVSKVVRSLQHSVEIVEVDCQANADATSAEIREQLDLQQQHLQHIVDSVVILQKEDVAPLQDRCDIFAVLFL